MEYLKRAHVNICQLENIKTEIKNIINWHKRRSDKGLDRFVENIHVEAWRPKRIAYTGIPSFIVLCGYCILYKLKFGDNSASSKSIGAIFLTVLAHFMSLRHILVILAIFQTFSLLSLLLWSAVIFGVIL